jgi:D-lactate dehydrogenase
MQNDLDVFFYEAFEEEAPEIQKHLGPHVRAAYSWKTIQEEGHATPPAPIISIRTQSRVPAAWSGAIKAVLARSTGYDHLLAWRQETSSAAALGSLAKYCGRGVAEHAALTWMALLRKLPAQVRQFATFSRDGLTGAECEHRTLLIVGVGDIGHQAARIGRGLGMHVLGVDIVHRHPDITYVQFDDALPRADVIVCAMNLTSANRSFFTYERLSRAKRGAIFVNVSRGECSPVPDLVRLLNDNILGGVALDVFDHEQDLAVAARSGSSEANATARAVAQLKSHPNVILTPHNAFNTTEALARKAGQTAEQVHHYLKTGTFAWTITSSTSDF